MTNQEAFDIAVKGLRGQGFQQSIAENNDSRCLYRGDGGRKCALGFLIPDEAYKEAMECPVYGLTNVLAACGIEAKDNDETFRFYNDLQRCHDRGFTAQAMERKLREFAIAHGLTFPEAK